MVSISYLARLAAFQRALLGGLGKTTLAAATVRDEEVRRHFSRIGFASAGQEPATMELQRVLFLQYTGTAMEVKADASISSQRQMLAESAEGQRWLLVLDDVSDL